MPLHAENKAAASFAGWNVGAQDAYIQACIGMAGVVATQTRKEMATCIDRWYFISEEAKAKRNDEIRSLIQEYPGNHPAGVIAAVLIKACGPFK